MTSVINEDKLFLKMKLIIFFKDCKLLPNLNIYLKLNVPGR